MRMAKRTRKVLAIVTGATSLAMTARVAPAQTSGTWNNFTDATTKNWLTSSNWGGGLVPFLANDSADFSANSSATTTDLNVGINSSNVAVGTLTLGLNGASPQTTTILSTGGSLIL